MKNSGIIVDKVGEASWPWNMYKTETAFLTGRSVAQIIWVRMQSTHEKSL